MLKIFLPCFVIFYFFFLFIKYHEGSKKRIAFKFGEEIKIDEAFNLGKRATMGADLSLTITKVQPSDELTYVCEATAGPEGYKDASTYLTVFCKQIAFLLCLTTQFTRAH